jgi:uncharacterized membrane protein
MAGTRDALPARGPAIFELARAAPDLAALAIMAVAGLAISIYLTTVHYADVPLVCTTSSVIDCSAVTNSQYSVVPGTNLPITIPGMLWFVVSGALAIFALVRRWQRQPEPARLRIIQLLWAGAGLVFVLYLVYIEIVQLHRICEWCTVVHVLTLLTFLVALHRFQQVPELAPQRSRAATPPAARSQQTSQRQEARPPRRTPQRPRGRR